jgi:hypothetical protein
VRTETVEVTKPVVVALDPKLTRQEPKPKRPPAECRDDKGPILCNDALVGWLRAYDAFADKLLGKLRAIEALQPKGVK